MSSLHARKLRWQTARHHRDRNSHFDPRRRAKDLVDYLLNEVAPELARVDDGVLPDGVIDATAADAINIAGGKEDLAANAVTLFNVLDAIRDEEERRGAYFALYHVLNGTFRIAKAGIYPLDEMRHSQKLQAAVLRERKNSKVTKRDQIVLSVIDENDKRSKPLPVQKGLLDRINERLAAADEKKIDARTLYRISAKTTVAK